MSPSPLGVCEKTVRNEIKAGKLPHFRIGTEIRVSVEALREFIAKGEQEIFEACANATRPI